MFFKLIGLQILKTEDLKMFIILTQPKCPTKAFPCVIPYTNTRAILKKVHTQIQNT